MSRLKPWVQIHDRALPPRLFSGLHRAIQRIGNERLRQTYQTTFWYDLAAPRAYPEAAALALRPRLTELGPIDGVEWWLSRMDPNDVGVDFHRDRDEKLALRTGRQRHPDWSSVLFLNRCRGGLLAVTAEPPDPTRPSHAPRRLDFDLVAPVPNRFTCFEGSLTHGVLDARNQIPDEPLPGRSRLRLTLVLNWWRRRPSAIPEWKRSRHYRALALD